MGTRSLVIFKDSGTVIATIYRQYDGYMQRGRGLELATFLMKMRRVNGLGSTADNLANGMGCLAAQWIAKEKDGIGNVYMQRYAGRDPMGTFDEEYRYTVTETRVRVQTAYDEMPDHTYTYEEFFAACGGVS